jgi:hypothetical protein
MTLVELPRPGRPTCRILPSTATASRARPADAASLPPVSRSVRSPAAPPPAATPKRAAGQTPWRRARMPRTNDQVQQPADEVVSRIHRTGSSVPAPQVLPPVE